MKILEHGIDTERDGRGALGIADEVGHARDDARSRRRANLLQRGRENREVATRKHLSSLQPWIGTDTVLVHVIANI